jgi:hypothetical protein
VMFGALTVYIPFILPAFVIYQLEYYDMNSLIDLCEYGLGFSVKFIMDRLFSSAVPFWPGTGSIASTALPVAPVLPVSLPVS